jgi:hypothetical protein
MSEHGKLTLPTWFWSERWQAMEREADAAIAAGQVQQFDSADDLLTELGKL